jgi:hypothetical protein
VAAAPADDVPAAPDAEADEEGLDVDELRKQFTDYVTIKQGEILEARTALQYYHGDQWTREQLATLEARGQPAITFNRINRKIDGLVGVLEKLRGDPKAFGRIENNEAGAELATNCIRYALDLSRWSTQETEILRMGACTGIVVAELGLVQGDKADPDIDLAPVDATTFFYDPRSTRLDFSDCRYMGVSKLVTRDEFEELFPGRFDEALSSVDDSGETEFDLDRMYLWAQGRSKLRLVEHWYRAKGEWRFAFYAGAELLRSGLSPFHDEMGKTIPRYDAFAVHVDGVGDHYGFVRNLIGPQDALNQHRSKSVHIMNTRQLVVNRRALGGDQPDIETLRREAARPDGVLLYDGEKGDIEVTQPAQEFLQQTQYYQDAKAEIDQFGPNPALAARSGPPADVSGRSLAMQQQSGIAELGPFLASWRGWKLRLYRKIWVAQQRSWTAERVLRVTGNQGVAHYVAINKVTVDPFGRPMLANAIGQVDVDILIDEGPDSVNVMGDVNDTLIALAHNNVPVPPAIIIKTSGLPQSQKQELLQDLAQAQAPPNPLQQQAGELAIQKGIAETERMHAQAASARASAFHKVVQGKHEEMRAHATKLGAAVDALQALGPEGAGQGAPGQAQGPAQPAPPPSMTAPPVPTPGGTPMPAPPPIPGARLAPDGHHYLPDPHRPGKYLRVRQSNGAA